MQELAAAGRTPTTPARILIAEDSATQRAALCDTLECAGYHVVSAADGCEALAELARGPFDLVIIDIVMPHMDGYDLCATLRADRTLRKQPVILLTSLGDPHAIIRGLEVGADSFIRKPYRDEALLARVEVLLAGAAEWHKAQPPAAESAPTIRFRGKPYRVPADKLALLDLLLSPFDDAISRPPRVPSATARPARVLVAHEGATQAERMRFALVEAGFEAECVRDSNEALGALCERRFDLVIADAVLASVDGYALARSIQQNPLLSSPLLVLSTPLDDPEVLVAGVEAGASSFIGTPFDDDYLVRRVECLLAQPGGTGARAAQHPIDIAFGGQRYRITANRRQMLTLLVSSYEDALQQNRELAHAQDELRTLNEELEDRIRVRTQALAAELHNRALAAVRQQLLAELHVLFNGTGTDAEVLGAAVRRVRAVADFDTVGIRLLGGGGLAWHTSQHGGTGSAPDDICACVEADDGGLDGLARSDNRPMCACRAVAAGRVGPAPPLTGLGSFWTDDAQALGSSHPADGGQIEALCNQAGYRSMALIPLRAGREDIGLLRCCDRRPGLFSDGTDRLGFLEALGDNIGVAIGRRQAEARLEAASRFPLENPSPILRVAADGTLRFANPGAAELLRHWGVVVGDRLPADPLQHVERALASGTQVREEIEWSERSLALNICPAPAGDYVNVYGSDITDWKRSEASRVELRGQLQASQRLEAIGILAGGVAHDFNNLLTVIRMYTDFALEAAPAGGSVTEDLAEVQKAADRAATLTRQLLAFSRRQILQPVELDLNETATGMAAMLRRMLGEHIALELRLQPEIAAILADAGQIEQVLMNLAVNARDAMPAGGRLTIETREVVLEEADAARLGGIAPGDYVLLSVSDTGCGMDEATRLRVFEPFFTTKEKGKGTGLGLSTTFGIVKQSGGEIAVFSRPGRGSRFDIYLPRDGAPRDRAPSRTVTPSRLSGDETVLVVEDEDAVRDIAGRVLRAAGYRVLTARSGRAALALCEDFGEPIHMLLSDVVMPEMSGAVLAERFSLSRPEAKVMFMSGHTGDALMQHGRLIEGTELIARPFNAADLTRRVREVLDAPTHRPAGLQETPEPAAAGELAASDLAMLPRDTLHALRQAARAARIDDLAGLLEELEGSHPRLASALGELLANFDYDALRSLLAPRSGESDEHPRPR